MRFLSKLGVLILFIMISIFVVFFDTSQTINSVLCVESVNSSDIQYEDNTIFNLHYENKIWTMSARDFELNSKVFTLDARINNNNRNGTKQDKIKLINKLIEINIEPEIAFNYIYLGFNNKLNKIQKNIEKKSKNAEISIKNNKINIKKEIIGIKINKYLLYNNLIEKYKNNNIINIEIPVIKTKPSITSDMLKKYTNERSSFSTSIATSSTSRKYNVRKALNKINGTKLSKREKFSFNSCVGNRTVSNGYKEAKVILNGEFVEGVGGGVCQVSSTLYNAVLLAGLNVISSQKHSQRVGYVKGGFDAMVNYGTSDLVFENNTEGDIYILCNYTDNKITINIYGADLGDVSYELSNEIINHVAAGGDEIVYDTDGKYSDKVLYNDECFELKKARDGYTIKSYITKFINGKEIDKKVLREDKYLPQHRIIVYGTKAREESISHISDVIYDNV